jgi:hypothetical protein
MIGSCQVRARKVQEIVNSKRLSQVADDRHQVNERSSGMKEQADRVDESRGLKQFGKSIRQPFSWPGLAFPGTCEQQVTSALSPRSKWRAGVLTGCGNCGGPRQELRAKHLCNVNERERSASSSTPLAPILCPTVTGVLCMIGPAICSLPSVRSAEPARHWRLGALRLEPSSNLLEAGSRLMMNHKQR